MSTFKINFEPNLLWTIIGQKIGKILGKPDFNNIKILPISTYSPLQPDHFYTKITEIGLHLHKL